ncbi:MAG: glycosyltransferase family 2 protein [Anaerolineae bacterium]|jgi:N-acetylglucosaminyl-diphospho-decaprenol L-rhamnosyltransferase
MSDVSVIIVNWNTRDLLEQCLASVYETAADMCHEVIVVDNASTDGSVEMIRRRFPDVQIVQNHENVGFARANNQAAQVATGRYLLLLNSDARLCPGALGALRSVLRDRPCAGIVGARLLHADGAFQAGHSDFPGLVQDALILSGLGRALYGRWYPSHGPGVEQGSRSVDSVEGACMLIHRDAFASVGGFDEGYFMYAEEVDLCYRMRPAGWEVWYQPKAEVIHYGGGSSRSRPTAREADLYTSRVRFYRTHYGPTRALALQAMIYSFTATKRLFHGAVRAISGGRRGRQVVALGDLRARFRSVMRGPV